MIASFKTFLNTATPGSRRDHCRHQCRVKTFDEQIKPWFSCVTRKGTGRQKVTNQAGEFAITVPQSGTYSISAVRDTDRSEYVVLKVGAESASACVADP